jgi:hypothetical protein
MAYTVAWNESEPDGTEAANTLETELQNIKISLRERLEDFFPDWSDDGVDPKLPLVGNPRCELERTAALATTTATYELLEWATEVEDSGGMFDLGDPGKVTIPTGKGGLYLLVVGGEFAQNGTSDRGLRLRVNGSTIWENSDQASAANVTTVRINRMWTLAAGDYIEIHALQQSGGALNLVNSQLSMIRLG